MISNSFRFHFLASLLATLFDFFHCRFAVFNGDKIYDFIVIFSIKVNCFPSTSNHLLSSFLLRCWINLNVIPRRAALYWSPIRAILPIQFSFLLLCICFWCFETSSVNIKKPKSSFDAAWKRGERKCFFVLWSFKHFDIIYDCLLESSSPWYQRMWSGKGKDLRSSHTSQSIEMYLIANPCNVLLCRWSQIVSKIRHSLNDFSSRIYGHVSFHCSLIECFLASFSVRFNRWEDENLIFILYDSATQFIMSIAGWILSFRLRHLRAFLESIHVLNHFNVFITLNFFPELHNY